jgi:hypothetical protein
VGQGELDPPKLIIFLSAAEMIFDAFGLSRDARIDLEPNSLFQPDKAELSPCCRELIPCSAA